MGYHEVTDSTRARSTSTSYNISDNFNMEEMRKMMGNIMDSMARSDQLADIGAKVESVTAEVKNAIKRVEDLDGKVEKHGKQIDEIKEDIERLKQAPRATASAPSAHSAFPAGWVLRLVHTRGWAPFGTPMGDKIGKSAALDLQHKLPARLLAEVAQRIRWPQPFMTNHNVMLECLDPGERAAKQVADRSTSAWAPTPFTSTARLSGQP